MDRRPHQRSTLLCRRYPRLLAFRPLELPLRTTRHHLHRRHLLSFLCYRLWLQSDMASTPRDPNSHGYRHGVQGVNRTYLRC